MEQYPPKDAVAFRPDGELGNFRVNPFTVNGVRYLTSEHYFQSKKFEGLEYEMIVANAKDSNQAFQLGRTREHPLRSDWEEVKEKVMYEGNKHKFMQNDKIKQLLLETGEKKIIEHTPTDKYWGDGGDGSGRNRLGNILMQLRAQLRKQS